MMYRSLGKSGLRTFHFPRLVASRGSEFEERIGFLEISAKSSKAGVRLDQYLSHCKVFESVKGEGRSFLCVGQRNLSGQL